MPGLGIVRVYYLLHYIPDVNSLQDFNE